MLVLGIDTTATTCAVALAEDEKLLASEIVSAGKTHSEMLMPIIHHLLEITHKNISDVGLIAISEGPGSFTGVRIGVSTVKGLAFGGDIPVVGVSSLAALAYNLQGVDGVICAVMDARRSQVYQANFRFVNGKLERLSADDLLPVESVQSMLAEYTCPIWFVGDGYALAKRTIAHPNCMETPPALRMQNGYSVAMLARELYQSNPNGNYTAAACAPNYLRASQAERERLEREKKGE